MMNVERLTVKSIMGGWTLKVPRKEAVDRLAAYEDTGLEPEEIKQMCALARLNSNIFDNDFGNHIAELIVAERDGRLVVLPCKVGDTVYEALLEWDCTECLKTSFKPKVRERKVTHFMFGKSGDIIVGVSGDGADYLIYGKTVFLTREAAEAAMKGGGE